MKKPASEPLRGDSAYRAHMKDIARRNEAAQAAASERRAAKEAQSLGETAARAPREMEDLRRQAATDAP
jgi:hypothetical protein